MPSNNINVEKDFRGIMFGRTDRESNVDLAKIVWPNQPDPAGWGEIATPDEIRYIWLAGLELVTQTGGVITDPMIKGLVRKYTHELEEFLRWSIIPVSYRHRSVNPQEDRYIEPHERYDDAYDYKPLDYHSFWMVRLRHRPIIRVTKWELHNPFDDSGSPVLNLLVGAEVHYNNGILRNTRGTARAGNTAQSRIPLRAYRFWGGEYDRQRLPASYYADYVAGYSSAERVPDELRTIISKLVVIHILSAFGDAQVAGLASFSLSLSSISESVSTTQSATSATYGARIKQLTDEVKDWFQRESWKYAQPGIALL